MMYADYWFASKKKFLNLIYKRIPNSNVQTSDNKMHTVFKKKKCWQIV